MGILSRKLRIGEKIGFGFGIVGLLFLGVVWQYHNTLQSALTEYRQLDDVYGTRKSQALAIENNMLRSQRAERSFILTRTSRLPNRCSAAWKQPGTRLLRCGPSTARLRPLKGPVGSTDQRLRTALPSGGRGLAYQGPGSRQRIAGQLPQQYSRTRRLGRRVQRGSALSSAASDTTRRERPGFAKGGSIPWARVEFDRGFFRTRCRLRA